MSEPSMMPAPVSETGLVTTRRPVPALTPRQDAVLSLVAKGLTRDEIGLALGISRYTVHNHMVAIFTALGVSSRIEALFVTGWIQPQSYSSFSCHQTWTLA